ncbi:ATP-binding cassette domain-containing protein [Roseospira marina]|uniref:ATP-binding cassette domain-containing protein n=1 Tax=Roseospira marina TaxID=140057 RepID=A0A5M6I712_9PROT|nr:ATP-binding cassette domain-containing protein [Roseospira marina]KAA5603913.1 ATP-binding cassette domain-containing protein [Roseospira marina]MBB4315973.1 putative ABC transport system ATP-binding protein [Roseospira marina]MBB5089157.1 putative ABC transport system ATP-binding protein [Roseospira marina]
MTAPLVHIRDARVPRIGRDRRFVLEVPAFDIAPDAVIALVAPSGRGKSTLINLLALATPPDPGAQFTVAGVNVAALWARGRHDHLARIRASLYGYVVQTGALLASLTARENIALTQRLAGRPDERLIDALAERLGIRALLSDRPASLSVGERQRVAIARAVAHRPHLVLADEPTASLDPVNTATVMDLLLDLRGALGFGLIIASHDLETLDRFGIARVEPTLTAQGAETRAVFVYPAPSGEPPA